MSSLAMIESLLGNDAQTMLTHKCKTIEKEKIHIPGPDFVDRIFVHSNRPTRVLRSIQSLYDHGRLKNTGISFYFTCGPGGSSTVQELLSL